MSQHAVDRVLERRAERADALLRVLAEVATESPCVRVISCVIE